MRIAVRFWIHLTIWAGILLVIFTILDQVGSDAVPLWTRLPVWGGLALVLAAFPAGISVSSRTFPEARWSMAAALEATLAAAAVSAVVFILVGFAGPAMARRAGVEAAPVSGASYGMSIGDLRIAARAAVDRAEGDGTGSALERWQPANLLVWDYTRRLAGVVQPLLLAWIGLLAGLWAPWTRRRELIMAQYWAMGLFLVMSTYLAGENSYELIVLQAAGPVFFAGLFVLLVPSVLLVGLGWASFAVLWKRHWAEAP